MAQRRYNSITNGSSAPAAVRRKRRRPANPPAAQAQPETVEGVTKTRTKRKEPGLRFYDGNMDMLFFAIVIVLLAYGIIMMFSASYIAGLSESGDGYKYVRTQGFAAIVGVIAMVMISFFDYHILMNSKLVMFGFLGVFALLTYTSFFGDAVARARRWLFIGGSAEGAGGLSIQPSELMKPVLIVFLAFLITRDRGNYNTKKDVWRYVFIIGAVCANMLLQRHVSGLLIMVALSFCVLFVGGMSLTDLMRVGVILLVIAIIGALIVSALGIIDFSYVIGRFGSSDDDVITDANWQTSQSKIAIGSGGWFGVGFGESKQKYLWLPESQNDFIISIIVEELGYLGGLVVVILFGLLIYRGFYIAKKAPDKFGMLITVGLTFQIGLQALLNIGVACDAFPNTGISLPFFSYGGTALLIQLAEMGVILGVSRQCEI